jgi:pirin-like protein
VPISGSSVTDGVCALQTPFCSVRVSLGALLIGGVPFPDEVLMWWNYVARDQTEITDAHADWTAATARFGQVASPLPRIMVGPPPWSVSQH